MPRRISLLVCLVVLLAACGSGNGTAPASDGTDPDAPAPDVTAGEDTAVTEEGDDDEGSEADDATEQDAQDPAFEVVATLAPIADLVSVVGGDRVSVSSLVPAGADAHTYEPRPQDVVVLSEADAYIGVGLDLNDGAIALAEENLPADAPLVLLGERLLGDDELVFDHSHDDEAGGHSHDDEAGGHSHGDEDGGHSHGDEDGGHSHGDEDAGHGHDDGGSGLGPNPHVWTSLRNTALLVGGIAEVLGDLDADGAETYETNAEDYRTELEQLDQLVGDATATIPAAQRTLVTYHDAWTYFARDYDLEFATAVQPADYSDPSAGEVRDVIDLVRELDVPVVFGSEVFPTPVLETIAEETGAEYRSDLADDVLPGDPGDPEHSYLELMRRNAITIVDGLGGDASELEAAAPGS